MLEGRSRVYLEFKGGGRGFLSPYGNGSTAFLGLLPPDGMSARDYAMTLSGADFTSAWKNRTTPEGGVQFRLPEFSYDYGASLKPVLIGMGMPLAFSKAADFSKIFLADETDPTLALHISDVLHKAHIELDKDGTKAAACTAVIMDKSGAILDPPEPERVYLDRPFVYTLVDTQTGNPLFLGLVETIPQAD